SLGRRPSAHILDTKNGLERVDHGISNGSHILGETRRKADVSHISVETKCKTSGSARRGEGVR
ncbi:hypothetical protein KWH07_18225, partial [Xanthomonas campestris pv. zingibericola]|uniref:hypothetical protein n=1 Tax=Xanthomonas euvesicatoria TaxID=456327 RepID=UPI001C47EE47